MTRLYEDALAGCSKGSVAKRETPEKAQDKTQHRMMKGRRRVISYGRNTPALCEGMAVHDEALGEEENIESRAYERGTRKK